MPLTSPVDFLARKFDYLIVGGGTAGLVVAARLSENPALTVGVLEAGPVALGVETIDIPGLYGQTLGTDYDWKFETIPQPGLDGRTLAWPRGKVLGGTSALNFMTWNRASREDHDAWRDLGNKGWGWDDLLPYFKKTENFHTPEEFNQKANSLYYDKQAVGESGPIQVGSYSTTTYCLPNASRPNLLVLTEACVTEIVLEKDDGEWTAKGVRFQRDGSSFFAAASREVIISAGSVQSPQILELSGIGNPDILSKARISVKVSNPNVGENLQDHIMAALIFEVDSTLSTPDDLKQHKAAADAARHQFRASRTGPLTILPNSICYLPFSHFVPSHQLRALSEEAGSITTIPDLERAIRQDRLAPSSAAKLGQIEYIFDLGNWNPFFQPPPSSYKKYATCLQILQYPFSKGSIHISSNNIADKPMIDPQYYGGTHGGPIDLSLMVHAARFAAYRIAQALPLAGIIRRRVFPPQVPVEDEDESFWRDWLTQTTITDWHPVGTCAMGGRIGMNPAGGGVVDDRLRVYGTKGLRVVDASVMPLQISAHLQATVYAIGEKGAAMILEDAQFENE
ncbi:hypothetical protein JX266_005475 [Neoarthrinium moseri]|uniref:uncharacterized protein n=1 Tax=Neoarthrinium moseri TaxID=1658444 RepID=UPI001FDDEB7A|nr:uncharacterized protein JN550_011720 [Neoarthrinium moseri]KAI1848616.1 hypothetical protein JX266_005475 [Neoarthrinium moseri]KAI1860036.1 hypothetical protein JN550_011720 [Neoarthrinium moseri]